MFTSLCAAAGAFTAVLSGAALAGNVHHDVLFMLLAIHANLAFLYTEGAMVAATFLSTSIVGSVHHAVLCVTLAAYAILTSLYTEGASFAAAVRFRGLW